MRRYVIAAMIFSFGAPATSPVFAAPKDKKPKAGHGQGSGSGSGSGSGTASEAPAADSGGDAGGGSGSGSSAPAPEEPKNGSGSGSAATPEPAGADVDALRQEYLSLRDEMFKSRARASAVASQLYSSRITVHFTWTTPRTYGVAKASIRLDGASIYDDVNSNIEKDDGVRFDGYIAPGRHVITFHVEAAGKDDDAFTSSTESTMVIKASQDKDLLVNAKAGDKGDIAFDWKKGEHGSYQLGIDVNVKAVPHGTESKARTK